MNSKMISVVFAIFIAFVSFSVEAQQEVNFGKEKSVQLFYNFGQVKKGKEVTHTFKILNNSLFTWQIGKILTSCGCVSAKLTDQKMSNDKIASRQVFQLEMKIDTSAHKGSLKQFVYVNIIEGNKAKILKLVMDGKVLEDKGIRLKQLIKKAGLRSLNKKAIEFTLPDLKGNNVSLSDYKGKVVLLNFFTTWCPNCRRERPYLEKLYRKFKKDRKSVV